MQYHVASCRHGDQDLCSWRTERGLIASGESPLYETASEHAPPVCYTGYKSVGYNYVFTAIFDDTSLVSISKQKDAFSSCLVVLQYGVLSVLPSTLET